MFRAEMGSGVAANPYLQFYTVAEASGEIEFSWVDDAGESGSERAASRSSEPRITSVTREIDPLRE